jgi:hypothetical protein
MGTDLPVVTIPAAPVEDGGCARSPNASSADQIRCSSFVLVSTHSVGIRREGAGAGASTMLMLGLSREETSPN